MSANNSDPKSPLLRPILWTLAIVCAAYVPVFFGRILFFRDLSHWIFPARAFLRDSLLRGELPEWNPYQALGFAVFADPLYGVFYPPNWLFVLVPRDWIPSMVTWQHLAHLLWGTAGVCVLARRLGATARAMTVSGLAWALSGYMTSEWSVGLLLLAAAWVPWVVLAHLALLDSVRAGGRNWCLGLAKAALPTLFAVLTGEVFFATMAAGFALVFAFLIERVERAERPLPSLWRWRGLAVVAVLLGFGAGAVVIVPARTLLASTERAQSLPKDVAEVCSLHPLRLAELALPNCMGDAYGVYPAAPVVGEAHLDGLPLSYSVYMGASVLTLMLAALGRKRRVAAVVSGLMIAALLLALGRFTPVHGWFRRIALPLSYMRYPEKYVVLVELAAALLAGFGAQRLLSERSQPWRRSVLFLCIVASGAAATLILPPLWAAVALHAVLMAVAAIVGVLAFHLLAARQSTLAAPLLIAVVAFDLAVAAWPLLTFAPRQIAAEPAAAKLIHSLEPVGAPPPRIYRSSQTDSAVNNRLSPAPAPELETRLLATMITNTVNTWGIATLPGYDAAIPAAMDEVWSAGLGVGQSALRLLSASYVVLPVVDPATPDGRVGLTPLADPLPGARLYRVQNPLPRVFWAGHAEVVNDNEALARLYQQDVVGGATVLLAEKPALSESGSTGDCRVETYSAKRIVAFCEGKTAGIANFVEQYDPGWSATLDGRSVPLMKANVIMRAVRLPPGTHRIELRYSTPGLHTGVGISAGSTLLLLALAMLSRMRTRPR